MNTKSVYLVALTAILATTLIFSNIDPADTISNTSRIGNWVVFSETSQEVTVKPDGAVQITGTVMACQGQSMPYIFSINQKEIVYEWAGVEKVKCPKKLSSGFYETRTFEWHHVYMVVYEKGTNRLTDANETMYSQQINPTRQYSDTSNVIKAGDKLNVRAAFIFLEEGKQR